MEKEQQPTPPTDGEAASSSPDDAITLVETPPGAASPDPGSQIFVVQRDKDAPPATLQDIERAYITWILRITRGNRTAASRMLGISYPTIMKKIIDYHIDYRALGPRRAKG